MLSAITMYSGLQGLLAERAAGKSVGLNCNTQAAKLTPATRQGTEWCAQLSLRLAHSLLPHQAAAGALTYFQDRSSEDAALQRALEQCLVQGMWPQEAAAHLHLPASDMEAVWKRLVLNNVPFFRAYHAHLKLRDQQAVLALLKQRQHNIE
jgi:hypothetical protein